MIDIGRDLQNAYDEGYEHGKRDAMKGVDGIVCAGRRYIDRAELFNKLAEIKAPPEANDYKAQVYALIQSM